jgi:hypothetical protein
MERERAKIRVRVRESKESFEQVSLAIERRRMNNLD